MYNKVIILSSFLSPFFVVKRFPWRSFEKEKKPVHSVLLFGFIKI